MTTQPDKHIDSVVDGAAFSFLATFSVVDQNGVKRISRAEGGAQRNALFSWMDLCRLTRDRYDEAHGLPVNASRSQLSEDQSCWLEDPVGT